MNTINKHSYIQIKCLYVCHRRGLCEQKQLLKLFVSALKHQRQWQFQTSLHGFHVSRLYPFLQTEGKILWKVLKILQFTFDPAHEVIQLWFEVVLYAECEQSRTSQDHPNRFRSREPYALQESDNKNKRNYNLLTLIVQYL